MITRHHLPANNLYYPLSETQLAQIKGGVSLHKFPEIFRRKERTRYANEEDTESLVLVLL